MGITMVYLARSNGVIDSIIEKLKSGQDFLKLAFVIWRCYRGMPASLRTNFRASLVSIL
jgi:hypothetical protein